MYVKERKKNTITHTYVKTNKHLHNLQFTLLRLCYIILLQFYSHCGSEETEWSFVQLS